MPLIHIAFEALPGTAAWPTGSLYLSGLIQTCRETFGREVVFSLLVWPGAQPEPELVKRVDHVLYYPEYARGSALRLLDRLMRRVYGRDWLAERFLRQQGIDLIAFGRAPYRARIPTLGWIPDFQHHHLPELFTAEERSYRDTHYRHIIHTSTRLLVISETVKQDLLRFVPDAAHVRVVPPVSLISPHVYDSDPAAVAALYHLPDKFIYLPGQFWKHKNHLTAFHALTLARQRGAEVFLVCSGFPVDYRNLSYTGEWLQELSQLNLCPQVAVLGMIPHDHVLALMRRSVCVLNPSLFEGYGLTVDEARALGKHILASDLLAHREQNLPDADFFDPHDARALALLLERVWNACPPGPDLALEVRARTETEARRRAYAEEFMAVVHETIAAGRTS